MNQDFIKQLVLEHQSKSTCPKPQEVAAFFKGILGLLFCDYSDQSIRTEAEVKFAIEKSKIELVQLLLKNDIEDRTGVNQIAQGFYNRLPVVYQLLQLDIDAIYDGDPAANSRREVIRSYPGFLAIASYRVAHELHLMGVADLPRIITEYAHSKTGIDIHPGAIIGKSFCIDHGTGVVVGETATIGDHCKIYQGVTLGALSVRKKDANNKRHPTLQSGCIIYAGATILGGQTIIGRDSVIGGNVWLTRSVPDGSKIYYQAKMSIEGKEEIDTVVFKDFAK